MSVQRVRITTHTPTIAGAVSRIRLVGQSVTGPTGPADTTATAGLAAHIADTSDAHDASAVSVLDAGGYYTGTDAEAVLAELPAKFVATATYATTDWVVPTLTTGWTAYGAPYQVPRYRLWLGVVYVQGLAQNTSGGALGAGTALFTLPVGMRPAATIDAAPFSVSTMEVKNNGSVNVNNSIANNAFLTLTFSFVPG